MQKNGKMKAFPFCCSNGKVSLTPLQNPPEPFKSLLLGETQASERVLGNKRKYNFSFQIAFFGAKLSMLTRIHANFQGSRVIYHRAGSLLPLPNEENKFLQKYHMGDHESQN